MAVGGAGGGQTADINVTPLIDVLLVLLIIFMVITPLTPKGLDAMIPQPPPPNTPVTVSLMRSKPTTRPAVAGHLPPAVFSLAFSLAVAAGPLWSDTRRACREVP